VRSAAATVENRTNLDIYFSEVHHYTPLSRDEEVELGRAIREGDEDALQKLVNANLRFVVSIAKQFARYGVPLEDLINEGNLGLIEAAKRFDERRGYKFISYAVWWIRQSIMIALAQQSKAVRMPLNRARALHRLRKANTRLEQKLERVPGADDLAKELGITEEEVRDTLPLMHEAVFLDDTVSEGSTTTYIDLLAGEDEPSPDLPILEDELRRGVSQALKHLRNREAEVLRLYFGLEGCSQMTLEEIGKRMSLTRERIRQIKEEALEKMRSRRSFKFLTDYREMATLH